MIIQMEKFKNASQKLYAKRPLFFNIGLVIALTLCFVAFEHKVYISESDRIPLEPEQGTIFVYDPVSTVQKPKPKPQIDLPPKKNKVFEITDEKKEVAEKNKQEVDLDWLDEAMDDAGPGVETVVIDNSIYDGFSIQSGPEFEGGTDALYKYISENIEYPRREQRMGIDGRVYLQFVIEKDGSLTDIQVIKGISEGLDKEAIRVLKSAPNWIPGKNRGQAVRVRMTIPINFQLQ
jgi:protein TonB